MSKDEDKDEDLSFKDKDEDKDLGPPRILEDKDLGYLKDNNTAKRIIVVTSLTFQGHVTYRSRDNLIPRRPFAIGGDRRSFETKPLFYNAFRDIGPCSTANVTQWYWHDLKRHQPKVKAWPFLVSFNKRVKVIHFGINRFLIYDFL